MTPWIKTRHLIHLYKRGYRFYRRFRYYDANHPFSIEMFDFLKSKHDWLKQFMAGRYQPEAMIGYNKRGPIEPIWRIKDRLLQRLLYDIIKPCFKHLISKRCMHLQGPGKIKTALRWIHNVMQAKEYRYVIRTDIKSYYASIDQRILSEQIEKQFDDNKIVRYLKSIVDVVVDRGGDFQHDYSGIPRRSTLSGFFAGLYLTPLDRIFEKKKACFYLRYNDDIIILCKNKFHFAKAKSILKRELCKLKLQCSPTKTRMGKIDKGFHFLG